MSSRSGLDEAELEADVERCFEAPHPTFDLSSISLDIGRRGRKGGLGTNVHGVVYDRHGLQSLPNRESHRQVAARRI
jgi:hypothetical protein